MPFKGINFDQLRRDREENERRAAAGLPSLAQERWEQQEAARKATEEARRATIPTFTFTASIVEIRSDYNPHTGQDIVRVYVRPEPSLAPEVAKATYNGFLSVNLWDDLGPNFLNTNPAEGDVVTITGYLVRADKRNPDAGYFVTGRSIVINAPAAC